MYYIYKTYYKTFYFWDLWGSYCVSSFLELLWVNESTVYSPTALSRCLLSDFGQILRTRSVRPILGRLGAAWAVPLGELLRSLPLQRGNGRMLGVASRKQQHINGTRDFRVHRTRGARGPVRNLRKRPVFFQSSEVKKVRSFVPVKHSRHQVLYLRVRPFFLSTGLCGRRGIPGSSNRCWPPSEIPRTDSARSWRPWRSSLETRGERSEIPPGERSNPKSPMSWGELWEKQTIL